MRIFHLTTPEVREQLEGADEPYTHIYGPLNLDAVVGVGPVTG